MSKLSCKGAMIFGLLFLLGMNTPQFNADVVTYIDNGEKEVYTTPFYEYSGIIPYDFNDIRDIYITIDNSIYVVDESKVVIFYPDGTGLEIGEGLLEDPQGIFVQDSKIYVADKSAQTVFVFGNNGEYIRQYDRPTETFYGESTPYVPVDVVVGSNNKIYIASEGTTDGIIILDSDGSFLSFYGANDSQESIYSNSILNSDLVGTLLKPRPTSVTNLAIDKDSIIYSLTKNDKAGLKKINFQGKNILFNDILVDNENKIDLTLDQFGNIFVTTTEGIYAYNPDGLLLFFFSDKTNISSYGSIAIDSEQKIYVSDQEEGKVDVYSPSESTSVFYEAADLYFTGELEQSVELWNEVLQERNGLSIAYTTIGDYEYQEKNYQKALSYYELSNEKEKYSDAFYNQRQIIVEENFMLIIFVFIVLFVSRKALIFIFTKNMKINNNYLVKNSREFKNTFKDILFSPKKKLYEIKYKNHFSFNKASIVYFLGLVVTIFKIISTDFLFNPHSSEINILGITSIYLFLIVLVLLGNYFVSSIMYSEATINQLYRSMSLVFVPYIIFGPIQIILSNILTYNEQILYSGISVIIIIWSFTILYKVLSEMHNFQLGKTYRNILLTLFAMVIIIFVGISLFYLLAKLIYTMVILIIEGVLL